MRDPNRIEPTLEEVKKYWEKHPDLRLGQIICNFGRALGMFDPFYMEDDILLEMLKEENKRNN